MVEAHLAEKDFSVTALSQLLGMSRVTLHRKVTGILHVPAGEFIRDMRLAHAAGLLGSGEYTVRKAAELSGFFNQSYFSKCFKERYGCLPSQFHVLSCPSPNPSP
jgi:AraC-like DNA-binding protein